MQLGREEPAREVDVRLGARHLRGDRGERLRAVDEQLERVPLPGRKRAVGVRQLRGVESVLPAHAPESAAVTAAHGVVDPLAESVADLDRRGLEEPGRLELGRDRVGRPIGASRRGEPVVGGRSAMDFQARWGYAATDGSPASASATSSSAYS